MPTKSVYCSASGDKLIESLRPNPVFSDNCHYLNDFFDNGRFIWEIKSLFSTLSMN